jgi:hypothetical protein
MELINVFFEKILIQIVSHPYSLLTLSISLIAIYISISANKHAKEANELFLQQIESHHMESKRIIKESIINSAVEQWKKVGQPTLSLHSAWLQYKNEGFIKEDFEEIWRIVFRKYDNRPCKKGLFETFRDANLSD